MDLGLNKSICFMSNSYSKIIKIHFIFIINKDFCQFKNHIMLEYLIIKTTIYCIMIEISYLSDVSLFEASSNIIFCQIRTIFRKFFIVKKDTMVHTTVLFVCTVVGVFVQNIDCQKCINVKKNFFITRIISTFSVFPEASEMFA